MVKHTQTIRRLLTLKGLALKELNKTIITCCLKKTTISHLGTYFWVYITSATVNVPINQKPVSQPVSQPPCSETSQLIFTAHQTNGPYMVGYKECLNPFQAIDLFLYHLKTEKLLLSDVFRAHGKISVALNSLNGLTEMKFTKKLPEEKW